MARLVNYTFDPTLWPPPESKKTKDTYLFGFDKDYVPYIVRWTKEDGWLAVTLKGDNAKNKEYEGNDVDRKLEYWAEAPQLLQTVRRRGR